MIAGHIGFGNIFDQIIHAFNMPMFFVASGYCYKTPQKFNQFLIKKIRSLIIPYFFFATITFTILRKPNGISLEEFKHIFWINNINTPIAGIWFMTALLWAIIAYYFIQKIKCYDLQWLVVMLIAINGMTIRNVGGGVLPWSMEAGLVAVFFIHIGNCLRQDDFVEIIMRKTKNVYFYIVMASSCIISMILILLNGNVNMRTGEYGNIPMFIINSISVSIMILAVSIRIDANYAECYIYNTIRKIGRNSIYFLGLNQVCIVWLEKMLKEYLDINKIYVKIVMLTLVLMCIGMIVTVYAKLREALKRKITLKTYKKS